MSNLRLITIGAALAVWNLAGCADRDEQMTRAWQNGSKRVFSAKQKARRVEYQRERRARLRDVAAEPPPPPTNGAADHEPEPASQPKLEPDHGRQPTPPTWSLCPIRSSARPRVQVGMQERPETTALLAQATALPWDAENQ